MSVYFYFRILLLLGISSVLAGDVVAEDTGSWALVDNFEDANAALNWVNLDTQNDTNPHIANPQISEIRTELISANHYLIRKPAADGIVGNRKAISFKKLPVDVGVGETYTFYTRVNVEYFPNNHSFGLSNLSPDDIAEQGYDAFEPMIRITDKMESNGDKNDGTLMVLSGHKTYSKINNPEAGETARPLEPGTCYELWYVVNNSPRDAGGQRYDLYVRGGEFDTQQRAFTSADFRMQRAEPLMYFMAICNTGPKEQPYGNGGVRYDDIYMAMGKVLDAPLSPSL